MNQAEAPGGTAHVPTWRMLFVVFVLQLLMIAMFLAGVLAGKGR